MMTIKALWDGKEPWFAQRPIIHRTGLSHVMSRSVAVKIDRIISRTATTAQVIVQGHTQHLKLEGGVWYGYTPDKAPRPTYTGLEAKEANYEGNN